MCRISTHRHTHTHTHTHTHDTQYTSARIVCVPNRAALLDTSAKDITIRAEAVGAHLTIAAPHSSSLSDQRVHRPTATANAPKITNKTQTSHAYTFVTHTYLHGAHQSTHGSPPHAELFLHCRIHTSAAQQQRDAPIEAIFSGLLHRGAIAAHRINVVNA